jgi:hypothetical protein
VNELIKRAREIADKATPGPWVNMDDGTDYAVWPGLIRSIQETSMYDVCMVDMDSSQFDENLAFIAYARTAVPQLCDLVESLCEENDRLQREVERLKSKPLIAGVDLGKSHKTVLSEVILGGGGKISEIKVIEEPKE